MKLKFCGAAKTVTGSCTLLETEGTRILIDCGMFQGRDHELNTSPFPFDPSQIDLVILTHAHIDHSGRLPLLVKEGFKGSIYCTSATSELIGIMLKDSAHIQEVEAEIETKKNLRKGLEPVQPLYTVKDAEDTAEFIYPISYNEVIGISKNITLTLKDAGHLMGSAIVILNVTEGDKTKTITFSGDLGNFNIPIIKDYEYIEDTNYLVVESTYGDRLHEVHKETKSLSDIILKTIERGGNIIIPSFSVGRAQEILYLLNYYEEVEKFQKLKNIEIYLDSPLAVEALEVFGKHMECYDEDALKFLANGDNPLDITNLHITHNAAESAALNEKKGIVIISSSGMCEAGRIKHHLKHNLWRKECSIVFVGYQAEGTLGRRILDGEKFVNIFGEKVIVQAEINNIPSLSGHADLNGILNWLGRIKQDSLSRIFINHGDINASENLKLRVNELCGDKAVIPSLFDEFEL